MKTSVALVTEFIEPTVVALGLQLWGIEHGVQGKYSVLRIYIEREEGITIEDCERVSRQVSAILDVEDPIGGEYTLEVSSPGLDRPLFTSEQFGLFTGSDVKVRLRNPLEGRRKFNGSIANVSGDDIALQVDGTEYVIQHADIEKAHIVF